jgi:hypothetical protein
VLVLNACRSAHAEVEQESDNETDSSAVPSVPVDSTVHEQVRAFGSLAHQVSHEGVSGVVAVRYNVYVVTAAEFVADLYAELVRGRSLGQAATLARKGLADDPLRTIAYDPVPLEDWPVPVVFESFPIRLFPAKEDRPKLNLRISSSRSAEAGSLDPALPEPPDAGFFGRDETLLELDRSFETYRPLARALDRIGEVFGPALERSGINWLALDDDQRRDMALQVFTQIPVLWIWDNGERIAGFPSTLARSASEGGAPPPSQQSTDPESPDLPRSRVGLVSDTVYTPEEQRELVDFLRDAAGTKAKFLLTSRRDERPWRIPVGPMPMHERVQLAQALAEKQGKHLSSFAPRKDATFAERKATIADWRPLLRFTDESQQGRSRSLGASLSYGFDHDFTEQERRSLQPWSCIRRHPRHPRPGSGRTLVSARPRTE